MKKFYLISILCLLGNFIFAQRVIDVENKGGGLKQLHSKQADVLHFSFSYNNIKTFDVKSDKGVFTELALEGGYRTGQIGSPQLLSIKKLIEIPHNAKPIVQIVDYDVKEYNLSDFNIHNKIIPYQPSVPKSTDPTTVPFKFNKKVYEKNKFTKSTLANVEYIGTMRDVNLAKININPIRYNPATNTIRVYNNIKFDVQLKNANYQLTRQQKEVLQSPYFQIINKVIFKDKSKTDFYPDHLDHTKYPVKYLIVTAPEFKEELKEFIKWKTLKGFNVILASTDEIGKKAKDIKDWIQTQYNSATADDPAPTFLLLVGDTEQIPESKWGDDSGKVTDLYYACMDGAKDILPDIYYGRLSARNNEQLKNMIDKTLYYEKYKFEDDTFLNNVTLIAGADGTWNSQVGQPTINYGTTNYFNAEHGFSTVNKYLDSYNNCYQQDKFKVSLFNYTAHCAPKKWLNPQFTISKVKSLQNKNQYPLVLANCCESGDFKYEECIAEAFMRKKDGGAVAYIGSAPESYWHEDFYWSVGAHSFVSGQQPTYAESSLGAYDAPFVSDYLCADALIYVGNLAVTEAHNQNYETNVSARYYWEAYNCFGDPSLFVYLTQAKTNNVQHKPIIPSNADFIEVKAEPNSYVAISRNDTLRGTAIVPSSGSVKVRFTPFICEGEADIVVTQSQYKPYIARIPVVKVNSPYINLLNFSNNKPLEQVNVSDEFNIILKLKNIGLRQANNVRVSVTTTDKYISNITNNNNILIGSIDVNQQFSIADKFKVKVSDSVPDQHKALFDISIKHEYNGKIFEQQFTQNIILNAPILTLHDNIITTNGSDDILKPGESVNLEVSISNNGHASVVAKGLASLSIPNNYLTINNPEATDIELQAKATGKFIFNVTANADAPTNIPISVNVIANDKNNSDNYFSKKTYETFIGKHSVTVSSKPKVKQQRYPFDVYFKNSKTQILYQQNELINMKALISELRFNVAKATNLKVFRTLLNLQIRIKEVEQDSLSNFIDMADAKQVFYKEKHTLSGNTGWEGFVFQKPFIYSGTKNIVIEILWGHNSDYTKDRTVLFCSNTTKNTVAYGTNDMQTPPNYDSSSKVRPDIMLMYQTPFILNVNLYDKQNNMPIADATILAQNEVLKTDGNGTAQFKIKRQQKNFKYQVQKYGYYNYQDSTDIVNLITNKNVYIEPKPKFKIDIQVTDENNKALELANIYWGDKLHKTTNSKGLITLSDYEGDYNYKIVKKDYFTKCGNITITKDTTINIKLNYYYVMPEITNITVNEDSTARVEWYNSFGSYLLQDTMVIFKDNFEEYNDWATLFGGYTLIDKDKLPSASSDNYEYPNEEEPSAFRIMNYRKTIPVWKNLKAHSGEKLVCSISSSKGQSNDWLITPKLTLGANTNFSFFAKSVNDNYGLEKFKVAISTTDKKIESFTYISDKEIAPTQWKQFNYNLAKYANQEVYIAIQCISNDVFIFCVDDLLLTTEQDESNHINGYSIYLNDFETPIAKQVQANEFVIDSLDANKTYKVGIVANYTGGDSQMATKEFIYKTVSINTKPNDAINIYPNPTNGIVYVNMNNLTNCVLNVYNNVGQLVHTTKQNSQNQEINLTKLSKGVYTIKITNNNFHGAYKVMLR